MKMTLNEYLASKGYAFSISDYGLDTLRIPHGETARQKAARIKRLSTLSDEYHEGRRAATEEYHRLVAEGKIQEKPKTEVMMERAKFGHPDNESTQAARRMCEKRGLDWKNYQPQ